MKITEGGLGAEKRLAPRMPVDWGLRVRVAGESEPIQARVMDVSRSGVAVSLERVLQADAVAKLVLQTDGDGPELHAYAYVAWAGIKADHPAAGLRFMGIREDDQTRLDHMVQRWIMDHPGGNRH